jgi:hypothetical protein
VKIFKVIAWIALIAFVGIQFFPTDRNESDLIPQTDFMLVNQVPTSIQNQLKESCYDCHSNNTKYPWYNKIQPAAWYLEDHVKEGKSELNFNEWDSLSRRRKASKLRSIIKQVESDEMPLSSYTLIHSDAVLSKAQQTEIIEYMRQLKGEAN